MGMDNERGETLVELLAAIVLTSIIGVIGYSLLISGFSTYDRVKDESALRDEADLIIASLINELYPLKNSEIKNSYLPENGTDNYYFVLENDEKIGFINNTVFIRNRKINLSDANIQLLSNTQIVEISKDRYRIRLVLKIKDSNQTLETISEIGIINDTLWEVGNDET
ncbi:PulJ/GspJ family protein [Paucisalibacillus globulus]|uniref:PulJ/GspJ family protein n=1 Tax=Paucisalibacillus globulus TaxID=351095 RepID=UPI00040E277D|nr:type II secretion system protein [Paucisalibacillus globulus]